MGTDEIFEVRRDRGIEGFIKGLDCVLDRYNVDHIANNPDVDLNLDLDLDPDTVASLIV